MRPLPTTVMSHAPFVMPFRLGGAWRQNIPAQDRQGPTHGANLFAL